MSGMKVKELMDSLKGDCYRFRVHYPEEWEFGLITGATFFGKRGLVLQHGEDDVSFPALHLALGVLLLLSGQLSGTLRDVCDLRDGIHVDSAGIGAQGRGVPEPVTGCMDERVHVKCGVKR